jgi:hypothetical protein
MSLFKRIEGVFFSPRPTFEGLAAKPVWIDTLIVILIALIAFNFIVLPYMQKDQLSLMKDNAALKERLGEDGYARMIARTENPSSSGRIVQTFVTTPLFIIAALLLQILLLISAGCRPRTYVRSCRRSSTPVSSTSCRERRPPRPCTDAHPRTSTTGPFLPDGGHHMHNHPDPDDSSRSGCSASCPRPGPSSRSNWQAPARPTASGSQAWQHRHRPHRHELAVSGRIDARGD